VNLLRIAARVAAGPAVVRPDGWEAANDVPSGWTRPGHAYRGMTESEYLSHSSSGSIKSNLSYSHESEGTSFSEDAPTAESYVNYGRDDPRKTGRPTYLVEVRRGPTFYLDTDGYWKSREPVPMSDVVRTWRMSDDGAGAVVAELV
jgi:hypothetical protein